jgi:uncharacterized protein
MTPHQTSSSAREIDGFAPRWHTAALIVLMLAVAATGIVQSLRAGAISPPSEGVSRITAIYLPMIAVQWSLALYVCRIGRRRNALSLLLGERWKTAAWAADIALAITGFVIIEGLEILSARAMGARQAASVVTMLPHALIERLVWVIVAISVGFSEELVYRGYLQKQLGAFTHNASIGVVLQAILFGIAHGQQGAFAVARFALYGLGFGWLAHVRRSLLAGMLCHVLIDLVSGLVRA